MSDAANEPAQKHIALIWLIRWTGMIIAIPSALLILFAVVVMPIMIIMNSHRPAIGWMQIGIASSLMIVGLLFYAFLAKIGYDMYRKVNVISVANFAFIFSYFAARDIYYLLPLNLPKFMLDYVGTHSLFLGQGDGPGISYRGTLAFIAFVIFYNIIKNYLERVLESSPPLSPSNPPPVDPDVPEFPQKSPLVQM